MEPRERPPAPPPNNGQGYLTAHLGSDPVHQESSASQGQTYPPLGGHGHVRTGAKAGSICAHKSEDSPSSKCATTAATVGDAGAAPTSGCTARNWSAKFAVVLRVPGVRSHAQGVAVAIQKSDSGLSLRNGEVPPSEMKEAPTQPLTKRAGARRCATPC